MSDYAVLVDHSTKFYEGAPAVLPSRKVATNVGNGTFDRLTGPRGRGVKMRDI